MEEKNPLPLSFDVAFMFYLRQVWCSLTARKKLNLMLTKLTPTEMSYFNKNVIPAFKTAMLNEDHKYFHTVEMTFNQWCSVFKTFFNDTKIKSEFVSEFIAQLSNETLDNNDDDFVCGGVVLKYLFIKDYELEDKPEGPNWKSFVKMENQLENILSTILWAEIYGYIAAILWLFFTQSEKELSFSVFIQKFDSMNVDKIIEKHIHPSLYGSRDPQTNIKSIKIVNTCLKEVFENTMKKIRCKVGTDFHTIDLF